MLYRKFDYNDIHQILAMKIFTVSPDDHIKQMRRREDQGGAAEKEGIEEEQDKTEVQIDETAKQEVIADLVRRYPLFSSLSVSPFLVLFKLMCRRYYNRAKVWAKVPNTVKNWGVHININEEYSLKVMTEFIGRPLLDRVRKRERESKEFNI